MFKSVARLAAGTAVTLGLGILGLSTALTAISPGNYKGFTEALNPLGGDPLLAQETARKLILEARVVYFVFTVVAVALAFAATRIWFPVLKDPSVKPKVKMGSLAASIPLTIPATFLGFFLFVAIQTAFFSIRGIG